MDQEGTEIRFDRPRISRETEGYKGTATDLRGKITPCYNGKRGAALVRVTQSVGRGIRGGGTVMWEEVEEQARKVGIRWSFQQEEERLGSKFRGSRCLSRMSYLL